MPAWLGRHLAPRGPPGLWPAAAALCRADWTAVVAVKCQTKHPLLPLILQGRQGTSIPTSDFKVERALDSVQAVSVPATNPRHPSSLRPVPRPPRVLSELGPGELALSGDGVPAHQPHPRPPGAQSLWKLHQPLRKDAPQNSAAASDEGACQTRGREVGRGAPGSRADSVSTWTPQKLCAFSLSTRSIYRHYPFQRRKKVEKDESRIISLWGAVERPDVFNWSSKGEKGETQKKGEKKPKPFKNNGPKKSQIW